MSTSSARLLVLTGRQFACIRVVGRANFNISVDFKTLINELGRKGLSHFIIDLSECVLMDSTFLGVMAGFGLKMNDAGGDKAGHVLELLNPNPRITDLLENLGVLHLFKIRSGPLALPEPSEACAPTPGQVSREETTRACLEAHRTLMSINPANVSKFKEVAQFLAEDLQKSKGNTQT